MMITKWKLNNLYIFLVFVLIIGALFPPVAIANAQEEVPPATEETVTETQENPVEEAGEATTTTEDAPAESALEAGATVGEPASQTEEAPAESALEAGTPVDEPAASAESSGEVVEEPAPAETLPEVLDVMVESDAVLVNAEGEEIPLASQEAVEVLSSAKDPWFMSNTDPAVIVGYTSLTGSCDTTVTECHQVANPIQAAIADDRSTGQVVKILAGSYDEEVTINKAITFEGVADGGFVDALIRSIILNVDISGWTNVFGQQVLVNSGAHIQDGIDIVEAGGTVSVAPGTYEEEAANRTANGSGNYQFGLYVGKDKNGITVQGLKADGTPVDSYGEAAALIKTNATNSFGTSGIFVEGDNVTFNGLMVGDNKIGNNKTFEILGNAFTLQNSQIVASDGGSVYIGDWNYDPATGTSYITDYKILGNYFAYGGSLDISNGAGASGSAANRIIANNIFNGLQMDGSNTTWALTSFNGNVPAVGWFVYPVGGATITGNTYSNSDMYIRSRGTVVDSTFDWKSYWEDNTFDHAAIALEDLDTFDVREFSYTSGAATISNVRLIGSSINNEIGHAQNGDTVLLSKGTFVENVTINKSIELAGAGVEKTFILPALSSPNCGGTSGSSLCAGSSNIILVQANDVSIHDMNLNGNNPNLTSGVVRRGEDIDARNGIITNHAAGVFNGLEIFNTSVMNIYLRGIYASTGGTFNIHDNVVDNVNGESQSIAMMNWAGSGIFKNNVVTNSNDGIVSNWSTGTQYLNNKVENAGTGIHTDNYTPSASAPYGPELIQSNWILNNPNNGYGIFVFAPGGPVLVDGNRIENVMVGLAASGSTSRTPGVFGAMTTFSNNIVDNKNLAGSIGALVTTDLWGWGYAPVSAYFVNNFIENNEFGFYIEDQAQTWNEPTYPFTDPYGVDLNAYHNAIVNNITDVHNHTTSIAMMLDNWWNDNNGPQDLDEAGNVDASTWLKLGLDANPTTVYPRGSSTLTSTMFSSGDPTESPIAGLWWFDPADVLNAEETSFGSMAANVFFAGLRDGRASFSSTYDGTTFNSLAFVNIVTPPEPDDDGAGIPVVLPFVAGAGGVIPVTGGVIPVTGGMNQLSCTEANTLLLASGNSISFSAPLCGFDAGLTEESGSALPSPLPDGLTFVAGMTLSLQKDGTAFSLIPEPVTNTVSFAIPDDLKGKTFVILFWDAEANGGLGNWVEVPSTAPGQATISYSGTFVLAYK